MAGVMVGVHIAESPKDPLQGLVPGSSTEWVDELHCFF